MDLNTILSWITSTLPPPWGYVVPVVLLVAYQYAKVRWPNVLAFLPHLVPLPPAPGPTPPAPPVIPIVPGAGPLFPNIARILRGLFGASAPQPEQVDPAFLGQLVAEGQAILAHRAAAAPAPDTGASVTVAK